MASYNSIPCRTHTGLQTNAVPQTWGMPYKTPAPPRTHASWAWELPKALIIRFGRRELSIGRDVRQRYYETNPFVACRPGFDKGHLEVLLFRRWVLTLSKAR